MEFSFEYKISGVAVTTLTKENCRIMKWDLSGSALAYESLTHVGNGIYVMTNIQFPEEYCRIQMYRESTWVNASFGIVLLGAPELNYVLKASPAISADLDCNSHKLTEVADGTVSTDAINKSQLDAEDTLLKVYADNKYQDAIDYINDQISNIPAYSSPQSTRIIRFWELATDVNLKIYNTLLKAVNSLTLTTYQFATILIEGLTSNTYNAVAGCLEKNNITIKSLNPNWWIAFADGVKNKTICLENMKVFFGVGTLGGYSGATRIYTGFKFKDCQVYCYNNLALYGGEYDNVKFYMSTGKTLTFYNAAVLTNVKCNSAISFDGSFNGFKDYEDSLGDTLIPGGAMPEDFTISGT